MISYLYYYDFNRTIVGLHFTQVCFFKVIVKKIRHTSSSWSALYIQSS